VEENDFEIPKFILNDPWSEGCLFQYFQEAEDNYVLDCFKNFGSAYSTRWPSLTDCVSGNVQKLH